MRVPNQGGIDDLAALIVGDHAGPLAAGGQTPCRCQDERRLARAEHPADNDEGGHGHDSTSSCPTPSVTSASSITSRTPRSTRVTVCASDCPSSITCVAPPARSAAVTARQGSWPWSTLMVSD